MTQQKLFLNTDFLRGCLLVVLANSFIGLNVVISKYLVGFVPVFILLELRYFFGSLILFLFVLLTQNKFKFYTTSQKFSSREKIIYFFMSICGGMLFNCIYMLGIHRTTATSTGIITSSIPTLIVFFSYFILKTPIRKINIFCLVLVVTGILILNFGKPHHVNESLFKASTDVWLGNFIVFLAMIPEALFTIFAKMLKTPVSPIMSGFVINVINLVLCTPSFLYSLTDFPLSHLTFFLVSLSFIVGLFSGALYYSFYNNGIVKIDAQSASLLTGVTPVSTALLSFIFLGESFGLISLAGMLFVMSAIYVGVKYQRHHEILL